MSKLHGETLIPLKELPRHLESRSGKKRSVAIGYRWSKKGVAGVLLESAWIEGQLYTSKEAIARFNEAVTTARNASRPELLQRPRSSPQDESSILRRGGW